jgi:hypothetical protein
MCIANLFGSNKLAEQQLAIAQQQQKDAQAAIAASNLDTESSRTAAEQQMRRAAASQGFASTLFGPGSSTGGSVGFKTLFGQ